MPRERTRALSPVSTRCTSADPRQAKKPRQSAPPPRRTPVLAGKKKPRVSAPAAMDNTTNKRKSGDSDSDYEEKRTVRRKVAKGKEGKEPSVAISRKDASDENDEEDEDRDDEDDVEEEQDLGESLDQSQSQSQRHVE